MEPRFNVARRRANVVRRRSGVSPREAGSTQSRARAVLSWIVALGMCGCVWAWTATGSAQDLATVLQGAPPGEPSEDAVESPPENSATAGENAPDDPETPALDGTEAELRALRKRVDELEAENSARKKSDPAAKKKDDAKPEKKDGASANKKDDDPGSSKKTDDASGEWVDLSAEKWTVKLGGHVQLDYINWARADRAIPDTKDYFEFRRLRLVADGTGYGVYDFRLQMTLEPETVGESPAGTITSPDVKDAYFTINEIPWIGRIRIGNFFVPFGLEQVTNETNNLFMERSIPTQGIFTADREVGVAVYNATEDRRFSWAYGMFFDNISDALKERIDDNQGYRLSGRWSWLPLYDEPSQGRYLVYVGSGLLYTDDQDNRVRFRARPQIHEGPRIIDSGSLVATSTFTANLETAVVWGPFAVQSEAYVTNVNMNVGRDESAHGAYAHASWFLTGENRIFERFGQHGAQFGRNQPYTNVFATPCGCGWGAVELKARYSHLNLNNLNAGEYNDLTAGFNWYWSDRVRVMFDWIHPTTSRGALFGKTDSDILAMRFDFNW